MLCFVIISLREFKLSLNTLQSPQLTVFVTNINLVIKILPSTVKPRQQILFY